MKRIFTFLFLLFFYILPDLQASLIETLSIKDGLSSRKVYASVMDNKGFMWFATQAGLDRYNGQKFTHYNIPVATSIFDEKLKGVTCSLKGEIYAFSSHYLYMYSEAKDSVILVNQLSLNHNETLYSLYFDHENILWLGTNNGIYYSTDHKNFYNIGIKNKYSTYVINRKDDILWIGTSTGLKKLNIRKNNETIEIYDTKEIGNIYNRIQSLFYDNETNELWIGTFNNGLYSYNTRTLDMQSIDISEHKYPIRSITAVDKNNIWVGIDGAGIYEINRYTKENTEIYSTLTDYEKAIESNGIYDIKSYNDFVWISTFHSGVLVYNKGMITEKTYYIENKNSGDFAGNYVNAVMEDSKGNLWFGTNKGISVLTKDNKWKQFSLNKKKNLIINVLFEDSKNRVWAGGYASELLRIDLNTNKIEPVIFNKSSRPHKNFVFSITEDSNSMIWFGGTVNDLIRYNPENNRHKRFPIRNINKIIQLNTDTMVIATGNGVIFLNQNTEKIDTLNLLTCKNSNAIHAYPLITSILESKNMPNCIWIGTDGEGMYKYNCQTTELEHISIKNGLSSDVIYGIQEDENNRLWISTENGLNCYDTQKGKINWYNTFDGLPVNTFNIRAYGKRKNGNLIWGTTNGAVEINPYFIKEDPENRFNIRFEKFLLAYNQITVDTKNSPLKDGIDNTEKIDLKYDQNSFTFDFININNAENMNVLYSWKLKGFDKDFSLPSHEHKATYTNVPPGDYTFTVKVQNPQNENAFATRNIKIHIGKPFWETPIAIISYIILSIYIIYIIARAYKDRLDAKDSDQKIRFFINIAHDIRTPLTLIKAPLNEIETEPLSDNGKSALVLANKNIDKLLNLVSQLLDFQKLEREAMKLYVEETNLNAFIENCTLNFSMLARKKNIFLDVQLPEEKHTGWIDRKKITIIIDNLVSNAIKYTGTGGNVCVKMEITNQTMILEIIDDGIGIPQSAQKRLFDRFYRAENTSNSAITGSGIGLMLTKKIVNLHKGEISVSSKEKIGTTFRVSIPIDKNKYDLKEILFKDAKISTNEIPTEKSNNNIRLLLVEDNDELRSYFCHLLKNKYDIIGVANGEEALELVHKDSPDFILSDVMMPGISGIELCRQLKKNIETCHIPLILLTSLSEREDVINGLNAGADDYITKPFDLTILESKINAILKNRKLIKKKYFEKDDFTSENSGMNQLDIDFMKKVVECIEEKMADEDFTIDSLAVEMAMSRSVFYKKLKSLTGQNPQDFVKEMRMQKAAALLREKKYSVSEISYLVGFPNAKYFSTAFKKYFGTSPSAFLNDMSNTE